MPFDPDYHSREYDWIRPPTPLEKVIVNAKPTPQPLPFTPRRPRSPPTLTRESPNNPRKQHHGLFRPALGDGVLLSHMGPNHPEVARKATELALYSASHSEMSDSEPESKSPPKLYSKSIRATPGLARQVIDKLDAQIPSDSTIDAEPQSPVSAPRENQLSPLISPDVGGLQISALEPDGSEAARPRTASSAMKLDGPSPLPFGAGADSLATSPNLREHTIPDSEGAPTDKLPALQSPASPTSDGGPVSPVQHQRLPNFAEMDKLAEAANNDQDVRVNGFAHRQSISSVNTPLPVLTQVSPISPNSEMSPNDSMYKPLSTTSPNFPPTPQYDRRFSHASELGHSPFLPMPANGPTPESLDSVPSTHTTPADPAQMHRMSIDVKTRVLPLPVASMGSGIAHISTSTGSYKCDFIGCNAPPFQTQYLLNSHANVHSQNRPHYCPVRGCPRGEGGKGFKRKNEMIRHGLVHDSPGYVCPFCPERDHRYPRPDNLQRHVRVHHIDKDKDDPLLRDVLAQRPEGPSRGRRRRTGV